MTTTVPLSVLIAVLAALEDVVEEQSVTIPLVLWRKCLTARSSLAWRVKALIDAAAPAGVTPDHIDALQTAAFAEGFKQAIEQGETVMS